MGWVTKRGLRQCLFLLPGRSSFSQIGHIIFRALVALKTSVPFVCRFVSCSSRIKVNRQTDRPSTVTLAAHALRGIIKETAEISSGTVYTISLYYLGAATPQPCSTTIMNMCDDSYLVFSYLIIFHGKVLAMFLTAVSSTFLLF